MFKIYLSRDLNGSVIKKIQLKNGFTVHNKGDKTDLKWQEGHKGQRCILVENSIEKLEFTFLWAEIEEGKLKLKLTNPTEIGEFNKMFEKQHALVG